MSRARAILFKQRPRVVSMFKIPVCMRKRNQIKGHNDGQSVPVPFPDFHGRFLKNHESPRVLQKRW